MDEILKKSFQKATISNIDNLSNLLIVLKQVISRNPMSENKNA